MPSNKERVANPRSKSFEAGFMSDALLVLNAGSSSLKFYVLPDEEAPQPLLRGQRQEQIAKAR